MIGFHPLFGARAVPGRFAAARRFRTVPVRHRLTTGSNDLMNVFFRSLCSAPLRSLVLTIVAGVVAGCGGGSESTNTSSRDATAMVVERTDSVKAVTVSTTGVTIASDNGTWVPCAQENGVCSFSGTQTVRYGAGTTFVSGTFTGSVNCSNATFGDPLVGTVKSCSYLQAPAATDTWVDCAVESGFCTFSGTHVVRYGAGTTFATGTYTDGVLCSNAIFGDPLVGTVKACSYLSTTPAPPTPGSGTWVSCASESQVCAFTGTLLVRYGAGNTFVTGTFTNGVSCSNDVFGDPLPGVVKSCSYFVPTVTPPTPPTPPVPTTALDAARLLDQSAFGPTPATVAAVQTQGAAAYIDAQIATTTTGYVPIAYIDSNSAIGCPTGSAATCFRDNYTPFPLQLQFFRNAMTGVDQLRQRVAFAYSQIFVISGLDIKPTYGMRAYQQMLLDNAFVNYRVLLEKVTLSPAMGDYLDMVNNDKPSATVQANENYAREVLQLFSIGLSKLNADGTTVNDANGVPVPSYDQATVQAYARAFTGWTYAARSGVASRWTNPINYLGDMVPFDAHHDIAAKVLLDGRSIAAGQSTTRDLADALDTIHNHPNVGPFIGRQLIQALVTSNPTPAYVARITAVFNDNGAGVRGDMAAVVRAILLDGEARGDAKSDVAYGKLRDPAVDAVSVARAFGATTDGVYLNAQATAMGQGVYQPPSVFSFYPPGYALPRSATLLGPQFAVNNTTTGVARFNFLYALLYSANGIAADTSVAGSTGTRIDLSSYTPLAATPSALVDQLNAAMMHGSMPAGEKAAIVTAVTSIAATDPTGRTRMAAYLVAASPRYQITR